MSTSLTVKPLTIDLPVIDEQHKKLISLSNGLIQAMVNGMGHDVLEELFEELLEYTCYHFADEEKYMEQINYPDIDKQKQSHKQLTNDVVAFRVRILADQTVPPTEALDFINNWIIRHIKEMDTDISTFAKANHHLSQ